MLGILCDELLQLASGNGPQACPARRKALIADRERGSQGLFQVCESFHGIVVVRLARQETEVEIDSMSCGH